MVEFAEDYCLFVYSIFKNEREDAGLIVSLGWSTYNLNFTHHVINNAFQFFSFHLDHCGGLPYFLQKTAFKGRVFMTHATKAIYRWLLSDYVKVR